MENPRIRNIIFVLVGVMVLAAGAPAQATFYSISGTLTLSAAGTTTRVVGAENEGVKATAPAPVPISVPAQLFASKGGFKAYFPNYPSVAQWISNFTTTQHAKMNLVKNGGPGGFGFCPPVGNAKNPNCTAPAQATAGFNGLIKYTQGANTFGGTMKLIRVQNGEVSRRIATNPLQFSHTPRILTS